ncbi:GNAT family N-acetyltransferase [Schumannella sp. 10F1B-5-1]|uniref:GNAT family N-acetyltransferase n=1 Tax=Schumannella sp. 10F1B-5-1 TaxID=2590780 RepID=UPI001C644645|nr:GNAT family N-acetyltransferase [Schumannella sp. 10F1B-5-1]
MSAPVIRPISADDLAALVAINDAAHPAVPITGVDEMRALVAESAIAVAVDDGEVAGFLLAMEPGLDYASENYRWFAERSDSFLYVDRIVLDERLRGQGVGRRLYEAVFDRARLAGFGEVDCEVNVDPPNPGSLAFHARMGFEEVGRQSTKGGEFVVSLLAAPVD